MDIKTIVKRSKVAYYIYFYVLSALVNIFKLFLHTDNKLILFVSYGGRHYSDSPRVIYEAMIKDKRFEGYKMVWAFTHPEKYDYITNRINIDSIEYIKTALKARCWITNVIIERALDFTGIHTFYFHTTHGVLPKKDGLDGKDKKNFKTLAKMKFDCCTVQSEIDREIYAGMMGISQDVIKVTGFCKNDILVNHSPEYRNSLREKFGIPDGKKAILYAPTFREEDNFKERFDVNVDLWRSYLGDEYVLLYRAHPIVTTTIKKNDDFFIDVTSCEMVEETMIAADILVSDYSGIVFDFCIMDKPIFLWTYDYDIYERVRGLYFDIRKELPSESEEKKLLEMIFKADFDTIVKEYVIPFRSKYATEYGNGTNNALNIIYNNIQ